MPALVKTLNEIMSLFSGKGNAQLEENLIKLIIEHIVQSIKKMQSSPSLGIT